MWNFSTVTYICGHDLFLSPQLSVPSARKIHTSPALFSLERVMANFRARSQLLQSRLEDHDDVNQQRFSDDSMDAEDLMLEQEEHK